VRGPLLPTGGRIIPFTPFHFDPGLLAKVVLPRHFWLTSFLAANVLVDVEVLFWLWRGERAIHRLLHSYLGGVTIGIFAGVFMFSILRLLRKFPPFESTSTHNPTDGGWSHHLIQSVIAGLIGGVSHVFLDSLMHRDIRPFWPFSDANGMLGVVGVGSLHVACAAAGFIGIVLWLLLQSSK
jgi:membrane-bound metal-dependent hydrolase YbcI (DUF457 family)